MSTVNNGAMESRNGARKEGGYEEMEDKWKYNDMRQKKQEEKDKEETDKEEKKRQEEDCNDHLEYWRKKRQDRGKEDAKDEEVRKAKARRVPSTPTQAEVEEHLPLHMPYRDWCPFCVAAEGTQNHSRRATTD